jgi:predicted RNase H-like HicB family nuclease
VAKKFREVRKALRGAGWIKVRQAGSHETWERYGSCRHARCDPARDWAQGSPVKDYLVTYEQADDGGWGAHSPDVEGVFALGETRDEAETRIAEALAAHLAYLRQSGRPVPEPHTQAGRVAA